MTEDMDENVVFPCSEGFLTAEELVDLRKPGVEPVRQLVGDKFSTRTKSWVEEEAVKCSIANLKAALKQKRASRGCDLIHAEWDEEQNAAFTTKLKGKYVHHMGHTVDGKIALSPEESMFLLENGVIEIMNGETPMSTEEGFAVILKGNLSIEKYRVYSHLSQLGFIVVPHQNRLAITRYEMEMNLDKQRVKKRKGSPIESQDNNKKRLTFSGALCDDPKPSVSHKDSAIQMEDNLPVGNEVYENEEQAEVCEDGGISEIAAEASIEDIAIDTSAQEVTADANIDLENEEMNKSILSPLSIEESSSQNVDLPNVVKDVIACKNKETEQADMREAIATSIAEKVANVNEDCSSEKNVYYEVMDEVQIDQQIEVENEMKGQHDTNNSVPSSEFQPAYELKNVERQLEIDSQPPTEVSPKNDIDVMDVDSQDTEISCDSSDTSSSDDEDRNNSAIAGSQNSCSVVDSRVKVNNVNGSNSIHHMDSSSSPISCRSEYLLDADSRDSLLPGNVREDDDITLIEVTKKETKPLAVIDLLSAGEESSSESDSSDNDDDEISILKVYSAPSGSRDLPTQAGGVISRKLNGFKKEERDSTDWTPRLPIPAPLSVHFPDLYQKNLVCVPRPPLHLLPNHVNPSKEAYILDLNAKNNNQQQSQGRVWDSYKTFQEQHRSRHMNQSSDFQGRDNQEHPHGIARPHPDTYQDPANRPSLLGNPSSGIYGNHHPFENSWEPNPQPRFSPNYSMPNPLMNSVVSIRQQNMSMVGNQNQTFPSLGPSFPTNIPLPNVSNMGPNQIMSEVHRTAFAVARSMLSYMFNHPNGGPPMPPFNPFANANGHPSGPPTHRFPCNISNSYPDFVTTNRRGSMSQQRRHTGRPFPCHFRRAGNKQSWETVKEAVGVDESDDSDVEEVPITSTEVLWDPTVMHPLVKPGVRYEKAAVLNSLQKTQMAKINKCSLPDKCFEETGSLGVTFDVYLPGCNYRKTHPAIPKHRVIVMKATDPIPRFAELAYIQRKWNDGACLQIAFVDHGDVSFMSFNSVSLPSLIPNGPKK